MGQAWQKVAIGSAERLTYTCEGVGSSDSFDSCGERFCSHVRTIIAAAAAARIFITAQQTNRCACTPSIKTASGPGAQGKVPEPPSRRFCRREREGDVKRVGERASGGATVSRRDFADYK